MGDYFQTVVDTEVSLEDAGLLADEIKGWLIAEEIIGAVKTNCVLCEGGMGRTRDRR